MPLTLLVFKLSVQSSYRDNMELPADEENFDTVQWWFKPDEVWRIKTYAVDDDIHVHQIPMALEVARAIENTIGSYDDVIDRQYMVDFGEEFIATDAETKLRSAVEKGNLEMAPSGQFGFWNPDGRRYASKSQPSE